MSLLSWSLAAVLPTVVLTVFAVRRQKRLAAQDDSLSAESTDELVTEEEMAPPVNDVTVLGHGITLITPRFLSVKMPSDLGRGANQYKLAVRTLLAEMFDLDPEALAEQDAIWNEWRAMKNGDEPNNLFELIWGNVNDAFRARAVTILRVPALRFSPFTWESEFDGDRNYHFMDMRRPLDSFSERVQSYVMEFVGLTVDSVLASDFNERLYDTLFGYNKLILQALELLPEDDPRAAQMYARYQLNDPIGGSSMEDQSGWNPLGALFVSGVPEKWKKLADATMRERIIAEESGAIQPRYEWERAAICYMHKVSSRFNTKSSWSTELFASQVEFLLGLEVLRSRRIIDNWQVKSVLQLLQGEEYKSLRHRLVRRVVLEQGDHSFKVQSSVDQTAALMMIEEFGEEDHELKSTLEKLLVEHVEQQRESEQAAEELTSQIHSVMAKMA